MKNLTPKILFLLFAFISVNSFGQGNLVPNFSFEIYDTCPTTQDQIQYATGWSQYSLWPTTPDYYNACAPDTGFSVPNNIVSYQPDHRNCNAYAGIVTWSVVSNDREHIGIQLGQPLTIGEKYFISFYTVMGGERIYFGYYFGLFSSNIGIRLSTAAYNENSPCPIDNFAHINYPFVLNDSVNWTRISGSIIADSAYNYLIVGNFFDDANTDTMSYNYGPNSLNSVSYYLIDDICISTDSLLCNGGIDILPCIVGINEINSNENVKVFPNPVSDFLSISFNNNVSAEIILYDVFGQIIYSGRSIHENGITINFSSFPAGIYYLKIINKNPKQLITKKIIKL